VVGGLEAWAWVWGEAVSLHQYHDPFFWAGEVSVMLRGRSYLFEMELVGAWALSLHLLILAALHFVQKAPQGLWHLG
jgi:hypothetical protein